jgi:hypothetical protein
VERWQAALRSPSEDVCDLMPVVDSPNSNQRSSAAAAGRPCEDFVVAHAGAARSDLLGRSRIDHIASGRTALVEVAPRRGAASSARPVYLVVTTDYGHGWTVSQIGYEP